MQGQDLARTVSPTRHEQEVARTFALSYEQLRADHPTDALALALLARAAYCAPGEPIPRNLLLTTLNLTDDNADVRFQAEDALARLFELGLLEPAAEDTLRLNRLLAVFVRTVVNEPKAQAAVEKAMVATARRLNTAGDPRPLREWQPHLRAVTDAAWQREDERAASLCNELGAHLQMIGDYAGARAYLERALAIYEAVLGASHPDTARSLTTLGALLWAQGDLAGARAYLERALTIYTEVYGPEHPAMATTVHNLGRLLQTQGDLAGARAYLERALHIRQERLGAQHPLTQRVQDNLSALASYG